MENDDGVLKKQVQIIAIGMHATLFFLIFSSLTHSICQSHTLQHILLPHLDPVLSVKFIRSIHMCFFVSPFCFCDFVIMWISLNFQWIICPGPTKCCFVLFFTCTFFVCLVVCFFATFTLLFLKTLFVVYVPSALWVLKT